MDDSTKGWIVSLDYGMTAVIALASGQLQVLDHRMTGSATGARLRDDRSNSPRLGSATGTILRDDRGHSPRLEVSYRY